jgi:hypothetical protein
LDKDIAPANPNNLVHAGLAIGAVSARETFFCLSVMERVPRPCPIVKDPSPKTRRLIGRGGRPGAIHDFKRATLITGRKTLRASFFCAKQRRKAPNLARMRLFAAGAEAAGLLLTGLTQYPAISYS